MEDWHERQTIGLLPERAARRWGAREALAFQGQRWTFAEFHAGVNAAAKGLIQLGIGPGDRVALWMVNKKPEQTARALDKDGWFHTGDMGVMRVDGHLRFLGRYKDMLKIGGENVDPMEVEGFLMSHAAIRMAVAFVQLEPGCALTEREVIDHCRGRVASFKLPRRVAFVDEFPMTSTGKIQKVKLRERARREWPEAAQAAPPSPGGDPS